MTKQVKLKLLAENELTIFGIVSQENDLKISWAINKVIGLKLYRSENIQNAKNIPEEGFPAYMFDDELNQMKYILVSNRVKGFYFIPSLKNIDYLMIRKADANEKENKDFSTRLKQISEITTIIEVDLNNVREKEILGMF
jgi:hypothetical protein